MQNQVIWELTAAPVILRDERDAEGWRGRGAEAPPKPRGPGRIEAGLASAHWHSPDPLG